MKIARLMPVLAAKAVLAVIAITAGVPGSARADLADGVVAIVNNTAITQSQVRAFAASAIDSVRRQYADQPAALEKALEQIKDETVHELIERQLILHSFEVEGYKIPDNVIEDQFQKEMRERFGDRVTMIKTLQAQGMTVEEYRQQMRDQFIEGAMRNQKISGEIIVSPYKVETYYREHQADFKLADQVKLRMITLNKTGDGTDALRMAKEIVGEIRNGATFPEMATLYSQDAQQRQGGDRGWVDHTVLRPELTEAAFALKAGQTSEVIDLPQACYVLHVDDVSTAHEKKLADVRKSIEKILQSEQQKRLQKQWIDGLWSKTYVQFY